MIPTHRQNIRLLFEHVDFAKRLRPSVLMRFFQEIAIEHTVEMGIGKGKTLDKGLLWVVGSERFVVSRMPVYDEEIEIITYPGVTKHFFFPRFYTVKSKEGEVLIKGSTIWSLIDINTRQVVIPGDKGIVIGGGTLGDELPPLLSLPKPNVNKVSTSKASYMLCDINGHVNNTSYADIVFDLLPLDLLKEKELRELAICFKKEIRIGSDIVIQHGNVDESYFFSNDNFSMKLVFEK